MIMYGDTNKSCNVDLADAVLIMKHLLGLKQLDENSQTCADVDCNGKVELRDALYIQKYLLESIEELPVC